MVLFLKYDPKDIIITLGGLIWGPMTSFTVSVIVSLIEMVTISENGILGCIMNAVIYKKKRTLKGAVVGLLSGSVAMVLVMMLWNYLIAPIYMGYPREAVAKLLLPAFLPFNLLKSGLNAGFTFLLYKPITTALRRTGYLSESAVEQNQKPVLAWHCSAGPFCSSAYIRCVSLHFFMSFKIGIKLFPRSVREYSTFGGTS